MDPISAIFVMTVLGGLFVKGVDVATDGLLSAEVGAGVRGAGRFAVRDVRDRWGRANAKAREVRSGTRSGRTVQGILDDAGAFGRTVGVAGRVLFGEARRFGSGARSEWRTARDQARSARTERRGGEPWPIVRAVRSGAVRAQEWTERNARSDAATPNGGPNETPNDPNGAEPNDPSGAFGGPNGDPNEAPIGATFAFISNPEWYRVTITTQRFGWADVRVDYLGGRTDAPQLLTTFDDGLGVAGATRKAVEFVAEEQARFGGAYRIEWVVDGGAPGETPPVTPYAADHLGPLPPKCPDCGMALVVSSLADHRMGRDRCRYADMDDDPDDSDAPLPGTPICANCGEPLPYSLKRARWQGVPVAGDPDAMWCPDCARNDPGLDPNGDPNVPLPSTVPDANGDVKCGCCALLHKPLAPGQHCPACHIHAPEHLTAPMQHVTTINPTRGPSMDINSAPAAIAAAETFRGSFETLQSRADTLAAEWDTLKNDADTLHAEIATVMDGMGDFAIGGEADTAASVGELSDSATSAKEQADNVVTSISTAKEAVDAYIDNLHLEYDASIEAAAGKAADVHAVMQEA